MIRDPFYRQIVECLSGPLDPELFERCAADLLRAVHPTLVPVRGGSDAGMDGAVADEGGLPFPLVCTTGEGVIGNLRRSLKSYVESGGERRNVILATSQSLTARRRRNLEKAASEAGFTLVQIYPQGAIADLLYRDPTWCLELLNLTGDPPALSLLPLPRRPMVGQTPIGREQDLQWLHETEGDLLLVGQPGSGKTFLHYLFAKEGGGLFVTTDDFGEITAGIRSQEPEALIVDDAHLSPDLLLHLMRIRTEVGATFRILANSWPGDEDAVVKALDLPSSAVRRLGLLTRDEIVRVIKLSGIGGPRDLLHELVSQAYGKPGLAVTLCDLCLKGDIRELVLADALARDIGVTFEKLVGRHAVNVLASFSVGGDSGIPMSIVANVLEIPIGQIRSDVTRLAAGGVLSEVDEHTLAVCPPALRHALVRDVFFKGATSLPIDRLIRAAPRLNDVTLTFIGARARGGSVPEQMLQELLEHSHYSTCWQAYAGLGPVEADWVLRAHPEQLSVVAKSALRVRPEKVIPMLLTKAIGDNRQLHSALDHPLRIISDWIASAKPSTNEAVDRRKVLLHMAINWCEKGGDLAVTLRTLVSSLSPSFQFAEEVPGSGRQFSIAHGFLTVDELRVVLSGWPLVSDLLRKSKVEDWTPITELVQAWAFPGRVPSAPSEELAEVSRVAAVGMLEDVAEAAVDSPGVLHWIAEMAQNLGRVIEVDLDRDFEILFPPDPGVDRHKAEREQLSAAKGLVKRWSIRSPDEVARRITSLEHEAAMIGLTWPRWSDYVCREIAQSTDDPLVWVEVLIAAEAAPDLVGPFIRRAIALLVPHWQDMVKDCISQPELCGTTAMAVLSSTNLPEPIVRLALDSLSGLAEWTKVCCLRNEVPDEILVQLLQHPDDAIAAAAAVGEWSADPKGTVRESATTVWRAVIVRCVDDDWPLTKIFEADTTLASEWLRQRLGKPSHSLWRTEKALQAAIGVLGTDERKGLLGLLHPDTWPQDITRSIVGRDIDLYKELLATERLRPQHLAPLMGHPDQHWVQMAALALEEGYKPEEIAGAVHGATSGWSGEESAMWSQWVERFGRLASHENSGIRRVAEIGRDRAAANRDRALAQEREEAIHGI